MKSLKIRLELNNKQTTLARKHAGVARYAYNWGLAICKKSYDERIVDIPYKRPSGYDLCKQWVAEVKSEHKWLYETSKVCQQHALINLDSAYKRAFKVKGSGFPKFKKKGINDSFYLTGAIHIKNGKLQLPKFGLVKCSETLPNVEIKSVTVSRQANHWFVSFNLPTIPNKIIGIETKPIVGVDLGIKTLATLSDGTSFPNLRPYKKFKRKLKLAQRKASKKFVKGAKTQSNNYKKACKKVANIHYKISCIRKDSLHKLTSYLTKNHSEIVIEDLNVSGMSKNHNLASAILDGGFSEFRRQLDYKSKWYGSKLTVVDRWYPSSKLCSCCGNKKTDLKLSDRIYKCDVCNFEIDRDLNASINLKKLAVGYTVSACGEIQQIPISHLVISTKQELNSNVQHCVSFK